MIYQQKQTIELLGIYYSEDHHLYIKLYITWSKRAKANLGALQLGDRSQSHSVAKSIDASIAAH